MLGIDAGGETVTQLIGQSPRLLAASTRVGGNHDAADVFDIDLGDAGQGGFGAVAPLGRLQ